MRWNVFLIGLFMLAVTGSATATTDLNTAMTTLQQNWAVAKYSTQGKDRKKAFEALTEEADKLASAFPDQAAAHIWAGIVYSTYAGEVSMFSAGKQVKRAREELEAALKIDPTALNGSAYTSLGALLYQIPGFMGGDEKEAEVMLKKGLELNKDGIDSNYFYGAFLIEQDRYDEARVYLEKAAAAPDRPHRELADQGRRAEIATAMKEIPDTAS